MADFWDNLAAAVKSATDKEKKSQAEADNLMSDFIKKYRATDSYTRSKMDDYMQQILHPSITNPGIYKPQLTPDWLNKPNNRNSDSNKAESSDSTFFKNLSDAIHSAASKSDNKNMVVAAEPEEVVEYVYRPGDTFGKVLMKVGLSDGKNLWGPGGDVEYYSKQLRDQGISGNIPIGTKITLKKRK